MKHVSSGIVAGIMAAFLAGCGGGGSSSSPAAPANPIAPPSTAPAPAPSPTIAAAAPGTVSTSTTYSVYLASAGPLTLVGVAGIGSGAPDATYPWSLTPSAAIVQYPDGSFQVTDSLGNFDASQSSWALANAANLAANPNTEPEVSVYVPGITGEIPANVSIAAYAPPNSTTMTGSVVRSPLAARNTLASTAAAASEIASVGTFPRGAALFDNESRNYHAVASDSDGQAIDLTSANVKWSVSSCTGSSGAGKIAVSTKDASKSTYVPPTSGSGCDVVVATISTTYANFASTSNALYYDKSSGVTIAGTLNDSTNKAVPLGLVRFYGGGKEFYNGNLVALVANGAFSRTVPPNRTLSPVGGNLTIASGKATGSFFNLTPSPISAGAAGSSVTPATYTEGASFSNPYTPLPPLDREIRDAYYLNGIASEQFAFDKPLVNNGNNPWPLCSIDAIINGQANSTACPKVIDGAYFQKWYVTYASATTWIFTEPTNIEGGRNVLSVQKITSVQPGVIPNGISDSNTAGIANCTNATPCFTYQRFFNPVGFNQTAGLSEIASSNGAVTSTPTVGGSILSADGVFSESGTAYPFVVKFVRNEYTLGHQVQGQPLYTHTLTFNYQAVGATNATFTNTWYNAAGRQAGTLAVTRTPGTSPIAYTYAGSGSRTYYKGTSPSATLGYSLTGTQNFDRTGGFTVIVTSTTATDQSQVGSAVTFTNNLASIPLCPSGYPAPAQPTTGARACGIVTSPSIKGTTNNNVAQFTVDGTYFVSLSADPTLGSNALNFHL